MKNKPVISVSAVIVLAICHHFVLCKSSPLDQSKESIFSHRPDILGRSNLSGNLGSTSSGPLPTPVAKSDHRALPQISTSSAPSAEDRASIAPTTGIDDMVADEDSLEAAANASLADLRDELNTMATVKISHPNKLLLVLHQLARDVAWSMFMASYR